MADTHTHSQGRDGERLATLGLWSVPGVGVKGMEALRRRTGAPLEGLLDAPAEGWAHLVEATAEVRAQLASGPTLRELGERTWERADGAGMEVCFPGDPAWPGRLTPDVVPLLFLRGSPCTRRRWAALVGSRHPETGFLPEARRFAREVARSGVGVLSGAAEGVDQACHWGALDAATPTWAFAGSALDELDPPQARLLPHVLAQGGCFYSELPPGVRASKKTFPRRNRLIAGAADVVLVLRAGRVSGALQTAEHAVKLGRPVLALPTDHRNEAGQGCLELIALGLATLCLGPGEVVKAAGGEAAQRAAGAAAEVRGALSERACAVLAALGAQPRGMDELLDAVSLKPADVSAALVELELAGRCIQRPGRRYEKA
jgi:DNA processing protein